MSYDLIKAHLNCYAVLQNLEDLVEHDSEISTMIKDWDITIQFIIKNGPKAFIKFKNGSCIVARGKHKNPSLKLFFRSPSHFNKMMNGEGYPFLLKGFSKLKFLLKDFPRVTEKLEYYLKPTDELLKDMNYLHLNTRMTLNTAIYSVREIGLMDHIVKGVASKIKNGGILMNVLPDGPEAYVTFKDGDIIPEKGTLEKPMSQLTFKNIQIASDFLNGKIDAFGAIAMGYVMIKGQVGMIDSMNLILDRIPHYLD